MAKTYIRKTYDCWKLFVNYGDGWEHETTEMSRAAYKENRRLYRENCSFPQRWKKCRDRITADTILES